MLKRDPSETQISPRATKKSTIAEPPKIEALVSPTDSAPLYPTLEGWRATIRDTLLDEIISVEECGVSKNIVFETHLDLAALIGLISVMDQKMLDELDVWDEDGAIAGFVHLLGPRALYILDKCTYYRGIELLPIDTNQGTRPNIEGKAWARSRELMRAEKEIVSISIQ